MAVMKQAASSHQQKARLRAEVIMKVRCGLLTAQQAAEHLGVSRKTYYKWEERGLAGLLSSLADQASGRPCQPVDSEKQSLQRQLEQAHRECAILQHKMALKEVLTDLKLTPGMNRAEKK
jgi:transposase